MASESQHTGTFQSGNPLFANSSDPRSNIISTYNSMYNLSPSKQYASNDSYQYPEKIPKDKGDYQNENSQNSYVGTTTESLNWNMQNYMKLTENNKNSGNLEVQTNYLNHYPNTATSNQMLYNPNISQSTYLYSNHDFTKNDDNMLPKSSVSQNLQSAGRADQSAHLDYPRSSELGKLALSISPGIDKITIEKREYRTLEQSEILSPEIVNTRRKTDELLQSIMKKFGLESMEDASIFLRLQTSNAQNTDLTSLSQYNQFNQQKNNGIATDSLGSPSFQSRSTVVNLNKDFSAVGNERPKSLSNQVNTNFISSSSFVTTSGTSYPTTQTLTVPNFTNNSYDIRTDNKILHTSQLNPENYENLKEKNVASPQKSGDIYGVNNIGIFAQSSFPYSYGEKYPTGIRTQSFDGFINAKSHLNDVSGIRNNENNKMSHSINVNEPQIDKRNLYFTPDIKRKTQNRISEELLDQNIRASVKREPWERGQAAFDKFYNEIMTSLSHSKSANLPTLNFEDRYAFARKNFPDIKERDTNYSWTYRESQEKPHQISHIESDNLKAFNLETREERQKKSPTFNNYGTDVKFYENNGNIRSSPSPLNSDMVSGKPVNKSSENSDERNKKKKPDFAVRDRILVKNLRRSETLEVPHLRYNLESDDEEKPQQEEKIDIDAMREQARNLPHSPSNKYLLHNQKSLNIPYHAPIAEDESWDLNMIIPKQDYVPKPHVRAGKNVDPEEETPIQEEKKVENEFQENFRDVFQEVHIQKQRSVLEKKKTFAAPILDEGVLENDEETRQGSENEIRERVIKLEAQADNRIENEREGKQRRIQFIKQNVKETDLPKPQSSPLSSYGVVYGLVALLIVWMVLNIFFDFDD